MPAHCGKDLIRWTPGCIVCRSAATLSFAHPEAPRPTTLADVTGRSRVRLAHRSSATWQKDLIESMSDGVAVLDYDGDGWPDLFFVNGAVC